MYDGHHEDDDHGIKDLFKKPIKDFFHGKLPKGHASEYLHR